MTKKLAASALAAVGLLTLTGCGGDASAAPAPTVTTTVTAEPEPAPTVTVTVTQTVTAEAPVPAAPPAPATAQIPTNAAGMNAQALDDDLKALGFKNVIYNSNTGNTVILLSNWTVTSIDNAGAVQALNKDVVVHVTK